MNRKQTFQMSYTLHRPWSDILFETALPPMILEKMIEISDKVLADSKSIPNSYFQNNYLYIFEIINNIYNILLNNL